MAATKLATARTIAGVAFDGSANITLTAANVGALSATGGSIPGEILFTGNGLSSGIRFLPTGSSDAFGIRCINPDTNTGELEFYSTDDDVEPFVFRHYTTGQVGSGTSVEWARIDNEGLKVKGNLVYHPGNKPTAEDVGATSREVYVGEGFRSLGPLQSNVGGDYRYRWYKLCEHTTSALVDTTFDIIVSADKNYAGSSGRYYVSVSRYEG